MQHRLRDGLRRAGLHNLMSEALSAKSVGGRKVRDSGHLDAGHLSRRWPWRRSGGRWVSAGMGPWRAVPEPSMHGAGGSRRRRDRLHRDGRRTNRRRQPQGIRGRLSICSIGSCRTATAIKVVVPGPLRAQSEGRLPAPTDCRHSQRLVQAGRPTTISDRSQLTSLKTSHALRVAERHPAHATSCLRYG